MTHLHERVTDLVDGRLDPPAAEKAHAHIVECASCRQLVEAERLTKARLGVLPTPQVSADLTTRLLAMADGDATRPRSQAHRPVAPERGPSGSRRPPRTTQRRPRSSRSTARLLPMAAVVATSLGAVSAGLMGLSVISPAASAALSPSLNMLAPRQVVTMTSLPMTGITPAWRLAQGVAGR